MRVTMLTFTDRQIRHRKVGKKVEKVFPADLNVFDSVKKRMNKLHLACQEDE